MLVRAMHTVYTCTCMHTKATQFTPCFNFFPRQGRSHTFEHTDGGGATQSYGSPSHGMSLPFTQEGSMSSSQSVSSSNSRHSDGLEEIDQSDPANLSLVPRAPTMDGSPFIRPRKGRSLTLPSGVKIRNPASTQSAAFPEGKDKEMSLEDFLAEDHTPNRVGYSTHKVIVHTHTSSKHSLFLTPTFFPPSSPPSLPPSLHSSEG